MNKAFELIKNAENIAILAHEREDPDAVGSSFAMRLALLGIGKNAFCVFSEVPEKRLAFMGTDYIVFDENDIPAADLCICLDCANLERIEKRCEIFEGAKHTINIDHHGTNTEFAEVNIVEADAPATGEILYGLFCENNIEITKDIAKNLFAAISSDTGSFKYSNVRPATFEIAAKLISFDIDHAEISRLLYDNDSLGVVKFKGYAMNSVEQYFGGRLNIITIPDTVLQSCGISEKDTGDAVNIPRGIEGCEVAVSIRELADRVKISFRTNGNADCSELAAKFGGGGHKRAAGATAFDMSIEEVKEKIIEYCEEVLNG